MMPTLLIVLYDGVDLQLDLLRQDIQFGGPCIRTTDALHHDDGAASYDEHAAVVVTFRTGDREGGVVSRHG